MQVLENVNACQSYDNKSQSFVIIGDMTAFSVYFHEQRSDCIDLKSPIGAAVGAVFLSSEP